MIKTPFWILILLTALWFSTGCDPLAHLAKSKSIPDMDTAAVRYFEKKQWDKAHYLFESLMPLYSSKDRFHQIYYYWVTCKFKMGDLIGASFYYDDYATKYPGSKFAQEYSYMDAYCTYLLSDPYELDQRFTYQAIEKFQLYLGKFPGSEHTADCEKYIHDLIEKLAKKEFEQARLYQKIGHYKAAVHSFQNMIDTYPDSKLWQEAAWQQVNSSVALARVSTETRKQLRYQESFVYCSRFVEKFGESKYVSQVQNLKRAAEKEYAKFLAEEKVKRESKLFSEVKAHSRAYIESSKDEERDLFRSQAMASWNELTTLNPQSKYLNKAEKALANMDEKK